MDAMDAMEGQAGVSGPNGPNGPSGPSGPSDGSGGPLAGLAGLLAGVASPLSALPAGPALRAPLRPASPRGSPAKRRPDARTELPPAALKRARLDPAVAVAARPPLPGPARPVSPVSTIGGFHGQRYGEALRRVLEAACGLAGRSLEVRRASEASGWARRASTAELRGARGRSDAMWEWPDPAGAVLGMEVCVHSSDGDGDSMAMVDTTMAGGIDSPGGELRSRVQSMPITNRDFIVCGLIGIEHTFAAKHASTTQVCRRERSTPSLLDDAGLKEHSVEFGEFAANRSKSFAAKSFYHLLGRPLRRNAP